jgi:hypothetical protein
MPALGRNRFPLNTGRLPKELDFLALGEQVNEEHGKQMNF